jgi:F0F1-type ATP synthase delta subunit
MNNPTLFDQIIVKLRTTTDAADVINSLEEFSGTSFSSKATDRQEIFSKLPAGIGDILTASLEKPSQTPEDQIAIKREVNELLDRLRLCKNVKITIAFKPDDRTIALFSDWVKKNVSEELLLDIQFDKSIVGGVQIIAGGNYKDYSVRKNLINRFQIQREEIMKLLE